MRARTINKTHQSTPERCHPTFLRTLDNTARFWNYMVTPIFKTELIAHILLLCALISPAHCITIFVTVVSEIKVITYVEAS